VFELIALAATAAATIGGYLQSRHFVKNRLAYVEAVQQPVAPVIAGVAAAVIAVPIVWLLPLVGGGTALLFGLGVGSGVAAGAKDIRRRLGPG
jgi:hypothetical protein